ncbi:MAG: hypothetical protein ACXACF_02090 [Candidatus Hermodarchaeia archaeon]
MKKEAKVPLKRGREGERGEGEERCGHNITSYPFASFKREVSANYLNYSTVEQKLARFFLKEVAKL